MAWRVRWGTVSHTKNYSYIISLCTLSSQELFRFSFLLNKALEIRAFIWLCLDQKRQRSWSWTVLWRPIRPSRTNTQKRCPFHYRGLECKKRKSWNTWSNRQIWTWSTKWSRAKAKRALPREHTHHSKHPLPTTQEKTTHGYHQMVNTKIRLIIFFAVKDGEALYSQQKQDWELTVAQIMNSLLPNSDLNWRKLGKPLDHSGMT